MLCIVFIVDIVFPPPPQGITTSTRSSVPRGVRSVPLPSVWVMTASLTWNTCCSSRTKEEVRPAFTLHIHSFIIIITVCMINFFFCLYFIFTLWIIYQLLLSLLSVCLTFFSQYISLFHFYVDSLYIFHLLWLFSLMSVAMVNFSRSIFHFLYLMNHLRPGSLYIYFFHLHPHSNKLLMVL